MKKINPNIYSSRNINLVLLGIIVFMILYFVKCGKDVENIPSKPVSTKEVVKAFSNDTIKFQKSIDSISKIASMKASELKRLKIEWEKSKIKKETFPTATESKKDEEINDYVQNSFTDSLCAGIVEMQDTLISDLNSEIDFQKKYISRQKELFLQVENIATSNFKLSNSWKKQAKKERRGKGFFKLTTGIAVIVIGAISLK